MHWLLLLCIPLAITLVAGLLIIAVAVRRAPEGYQDAEGFHQRGGGRAAVGGSVPNSLETV